MTMNPEGGTTTVVQPAEKNQSPERINRQYSPNYKIRIGTGQTNINEELKPGQANDGGILAYSQFEERFGEKRLIDWSEHKDKSLEEQVKAWAVGWATREDFNGGSFIDYIQQHSASFEKIGIKLGASNESDAKQMQVAGGMASNFFRKFCMADQNSNMRALAQALGSEGVEELGLFLKDFFGSVQTYDVFISIVDNTPSELEKRLEQARLELATNKELTNEEKERLNWLSEKKITASTNKSSSPGKNKETPPPSPKNKQEDYKPPKFIDLNKEKDFDWKKLEVITEIATPEGNRVSPSIVEFAKDKNLTEDEIMQLADIIVQVHKNNPKLLKQLLINQKNDKSKEFLWREDINARMGTLLSQEDYQDLYDRVYSTLLKIDEELPEDDQKYKVLRQLEAKIESNPQDVNDFKEKNKQQINKENAELLPIVQAQAYQLLLPELVKKNDSGALYLESGAKGPTINLEKTREIINEGLLQRAKENLRKGELDPIVYILSEAVNFEEALKIIKVKASPDSNKPAPADGSGTKSKDDEKKGEKKEPIQLNGKQPLEKQIVAELGKTKDSEIPFTPDTSVLINYLEQIELKENARLDRLELTISKDNISATSKIKKRFIPLALGNIEAKYKVDQGKLKMDGDPKVTGGSLEKRKKEITEALSNLNKFLSDQLNQNLSEAFRDNKDFEWEIAGFGTNKDRLVINVRKKQKTTKK